MIQYSLSQDISSGTFNSDKLKEEIIAANCTTGNVDIMTSGDTLSIVCETVTNQYALDSVIHNHKALTLSDNKASRIIEIDNRTDDIIAVGFPFDNQTFSLSLEAQMNWSGLYTFRSIFSWPMGVTTLTNTTYELAEESLIPFIVTASTVIATAIGTGRALKIAINAATTQEELDAVVDSR